MNPVRQQRFAVPARAAALLSLLCALWPASAHAQGTPSGTVISSQASMTYTDANNNSYTALSNTVTATVTSVFSVLMTCASDQSANSNTTAFYACTVTNNGNAPNTFALAGNSQHAWVTALYADDGAGAGGTASDGIHTSGETNVTASSGSIDADTSYKFFLAVTVPSGTVNGGTSVSTLTATGSGDSGTADNITVTVTTTAKAPALTVEKRVRNFTLSGSFNTTASAKPAETLEYQVRVTNNGTVDATGVALQQNIDSNLSFVAGSLWVGPAATFNGSGNANKSDGNTGDGDCGVEMCGAANYRADLTKVTFHLGSGATEAAGGTLTTSASIYVYYRVTVK